MPRYRHFARLSFVLGACLILLAPSLAAAQDHPLRNRTIEISLQTTTRSNGATYSCVSDHRIRFDQEFAYLYQTRVACGGSSGLAGPEGYGVAIPLGGRVRVDVRCQRDSRDGALACDDGYRGSPDTSGDILEQTETRRGTYRGQMTDSRLELETELTATGTARTRLSGRTTYESRNSWRVEIDYGARSCEVRSLDTWVEYPMGSSRSRQTLTGSRCTIR